MFKRLKTWVETHKTLFALIITLIFIISQIPFLLNHEIWNDEATSWQLSKEITLGNFYEVNSAEPHPPLWQLVLAPFSKLGFPIITLNIISLVFVALAIFLIVRFAKMSFFSKFIFFVSAAFFYFFPIISRDYSMVPLAIALVCIVYERRHEKPLLYGLALTFLSQTHFLMYGLLVPLALGYIIEIFVEKDKKPLKNLAVFALPLIISVLTIIPLITSSMNNQAILTGKTFENTPVEQRDPFFENVVMSFFGADNSALETLLIVVFILTAIAFFAKNQKTALYLFSGVGFWLFVMGNVYKNYEVFAPKVALILLMVFAIVWINQIEDDKKENKIEKLLMKSEVIKFLNTKVTRNWYLVAALLMAFLTLPNTFTYAFDDFHRPFSNAKEVASFINEKVEKGSVVIEADPGSIFGSAVKAYIENDVTIYNNVLGREEAAIDVLKYDDETVGRYHEKYKEGIKKEDLEKLFSEMSEKYEHVYYFTVPPSCNSDNSELNEVLEKYERLEVFNNEICLDTTHTISAVYKIK